MEELVSLPVPSMPADDSAWKVNHGFDVFTKWV